MNTITEYFHTPELPCMFNDCRSTVQMDSVVSYF